MAALAASEDAGESQEEERAEPAPTEEDLRFPVSFAAIVNRSVVLQHFAETNDLRVHSIAEAEEEDVSVIQSCSATTESCHGEFSDSGSASGSGDGSVNGSNSSSDDPALHPPPLELTDRLVRVNGEPISVQSFQDVIDGPVGSVAILPLFKPVDSVHVLSGFARVEILSPDVLEFEPATSKRIEEVKEWVDAKARWKAEQEAREREIANNKELQERLEKERRLEADRIKREQELLEKTNKEEYERTRMTPHNMIAGKRRDGLEFRYEVKFTTRGAIGLNWDLHTRDKSIVSHLDKALPAQKLNVIEPRDQLIRLNGVDTSKMGPEQVVEVYIGSAVPRRLVFLVQMSAERAAAKAAAKSGPQSTLNWTLAFHSPDILRGWEVRLHLAKWSAPLKANTGNDSSPPVKLAFTQPITGCLHFAAAHSNAESVVYLAYRGGCSLIDKANMARAAGGQALLVVNNVKGEGRFQPTTVTVDEDVKIPVTLMAKLDGDLIISVMEHQEALVHIYEERPDQVPVPLEEPQRLSNEELSIASNAKKSARTLTYWYTNSSSSKEDAESSSTSSHTLEFQVLPALFGGKIPTMPYRVVAAYPLDTACHPKGLGILATRAVVVVKRGGCSFGMKLRSVQDVGGAGMLLVNSDDSLIPLMTDRKDAEGLKIWGARYKQCCGESAN